MKSKSRIFKARISIQENGEIKIMSYSNRLIPGKILNLLNKKVHEAATEWNGERDWMELKTLKSKIMERKFKIGDFVNYEGKKCEVLAYSESDYTINIGENGHDGIPFSFDEQGNEIDPHCDTCWYVIEGEIDKWENNMKHKVGDIIRIKSIDWYNEKKNEEGKVKCGACSFILNMIYRCGNEYEIECVGRNGYSIKGDIWNITDEMIDDGEMIEEDPQFRYFLISYRTNNGFANATFKEVNIPSFKRMREVIGCDFTLINLMELSRDDFESLTEEK